jgi:hypothetical protein
MAKSERRGKIKCVGTLQKAKSAKLMRDAAWFRRYAGVCAPVAGARCGIARIIPARGRGARLTAGDAVFLRGIIEFSNFCQNDCLYCGIAGPSKIRRYVMSAAET